MEGDIGGGEWETLNLKSTTATPLRARVLMQLANETITSPPERVVSTLRVRQAARKTLRVSSGERRYLDVSLNSMVHFGCVVLTSHSLLVPCDV